MFEHNLDQLNDNNLMDHLKEEKFELAIGEVFDGCFYGIIERVEIKTHITLSCPPMPDIFIGLLGIPIIPSFVPGSLNFG